MAEIKPFRALRFNTSVAGNIEELTCPPYDIISEAQRQEYLNTNENNVIRLELPRGEQPYAQADTVLKQWEQQGILRVDDKEALYIYEEQFQAYGAEKKIKGFICRVKAEPFSKGVVLPHEETLSKAKADRFELMKATFCNFSQIYSLYMDEQHLTQRRIDSLSARVPDVEMTDENGIIHRLWMVTDETAVKDICDDFANRKLYIADGHHRYETAVNFRNYCAEQGMASEGTDYVMMMLVDMEHEGLVVFPTHRLIRGLKQFYPEDAIAACAQYFDITLKTDVNTIESELDTLYRAGKKAFAFYSGGDSWSLLVLKSMDAVKELLPEKSTASQGLDVTVLHTLILEKLFGIDKENMAQQINLTYTREFGEAVSSVQTGESQCAFILNPTRVTEIRDVAAAGEKMPQKSTYFYPKLITGLVMNSLRD